MIQQNKLAKGLQIITGETFEACLNYERMFKQLDKDINENGANLGHILEVLECILGDKLAQVVEIITEQTSSFIIPEDTKLCLVIPAKALSLGTEKKLAALDIIPKGSYYYLTAN